MTIKRRLVKIEKATDGGGVPLVDCIYLCALTARDTPSDPRIAILMGSELNDNVSRLPDESAPNFVARVESILEGRNEH